MLYRDNVHAGRVWYQAPGSRSLTHVHTNVHCCHWLQDPTNYQIRVRPKLKIDLFADVLRPTRQNRPDPIIFSTYLRA